MNYYERHLGDYARDTAHLTLIEHGAYTVLLDRYYITEEGIPIDQAHRVARARSKEEKQAVDTVLSEFFTILNGMWVKRRVQEEITKVQTKVKAAQENGKKGGRPKANPEETKDKPTGLNLGSKNKTQKKAHQTPDTRHQGKENTAQALLASYGVSEQVSKDFLIIRKAKRAPLTETALDGIRVEAAKAQLSLDEALAICCKRDWRSFEASWLDKQPSHQTFNDQKQDDADRVLGRGKYARQPMEVLNG